MRRVTAKFEPHIIAWAALLIAAGSWLLTIELCRHQRERVDELEDQVIELRERVEATALDFTTETDGFKTTTTRVR